MKSLIATAVVALSLLSTAAYAASHESVYHGYPEWAQKSFESVN